MKWTDIVKESFAWKYKIGWIFYIIILLRHTASDILNRITGPGPRRRKKPALVT